MALREEVIGLFVLLGFLLVSFDRERAARKPDRHLMRIEPRQLGRQLVTIVPLHGGRRADGDLASPVRFNVNHGEASAREGRRIGRRPRAALISIK